MLIDAKETQEESLGWNGFFLSFVTRDYLIRISTSELTLCP
jgi:hypothetical protein